MNKLTLELTSKVEYKQDRRYFMQTEACNRLGREKYVMFGANKQEKPTEMEWLRSTEDDASVQMRLEDLQRRLHRVQSWGGAFREVEFSPDVRSLMQESAGVCRASVG